ncbi:hypothetical protein MTR_4g008480 [Medicago truncatula]|uniref:Uncharacterized protein n=1 Tax=Medicago truncatula TaxID=3880 RepID=A0A072UGR8_MEDTR|nr:hypothetical protein MTR_4g008480 [Medicago truncatula]
MKRKRTNSLQSSHQQSLSSKRPRTVTDSLYLPDECWESIFKFIIIDGDNINNRGYLKSLSLVSKQFLSITNRLRFSLNVWKPTRPFLQRLFKSCKCLEEAIIFRCPEVTNVGIASALGEALTLRSLSFTNYFEPQECSMLFDLVKNSPSLSEIRMEYNFENSFETSNSFMDLVVRPQLKSLCLTHNSRLRDETIKIFSSIFPNLQLLDLINCSGISDEEKGVKHIEENCSQLREINLEGCFQLHDDVVASLVFSRPSLRKITTPALCHFSDTEMELFSHQGCLVC